MTAKRGLGRGLEALLADTASAEGEETRRLPLELMRPAEYQPRRTFDEAELDALAQSIRVNGILQPLLVRPLDAFGEAYEIVAGERRWRAAQRAGLVDVPVVVRRISEAEALELALLENVQRTDLSPIEEGWGYRQLVDAYGHTQEQLAERVGKSRPHIANLMRLTHLPASIQALVSEGKLTAGHARALLGVAEPEALARVVIEKGLNVRQTEALVKAQARTRPSMPREPDPDIAELTQRLTAQLGLKVELKTRGTGGRLMISYSSPDQLEDLLAKLR